MSEYKRKPFRPPSAKTEKSLPAACLMGAGFGLLSLFSLLLLFSAVAAGVEDPGLFYLPMALCSTYLGALAAGILSVRLSGDGVLSGLFGGCLYAAALFALSLLPLPASGLPSSVDHILLALTIPAAVLGSVMGHRKPKQPFRRKG